MDNGQAPQDPNMQALQQMAGVADKPKSSLLSNKKVLAIGGGILVLLVIVGLLAVFSKPKTANTNVPVTLTLWGTSVDEETMAPILDDFTKEFPLIKVTYEQQSQTDYKDRLKKRLQLKNVTALPDVAEMDEVWMDELSPYFKVVSDTKVAERYPDLSRKNNTVSNYLFGAPFRFDTIALAYNKQYMSEINLSETDFNKLDWSSLVIRAQNLTKTQRVKIDETVKTNLPKDYYDKLIRGGISIGSPANVTNADKILELLLIQDDANIYNATTRKFVLDSKFDEVVTFYTNFAKENVWDDTLGNDLDAFASGKLAMILVTGRDIDYIQKINPNLKFVTVLPARIGGIRDISLSTTLVMPSSRPYYAQSQRLIEYMTRPSTTTKLFNAKNRNTFIPAQLESLASIPKESPFAVFFDICPNAERFKTPDYENTNELLKKYLQDGFNRNFGQLAKGQKLQTFVAPSSNLQASLNDLLKPKTTGQ